ncbi:MAG TPA: hypothetical protein VFK57_12330 [Vicinamibacterales bacterium]|nr:hypothetical protein [Vicinamibacterales bacterium]
MSACDFDVVLYFYDELKPSERARAAHHVRGCEVCRQRLDDLNAIREALAARPVVDAPPAGDWSGFMRRLDAAVPPARPRQPRAPAAILEFRQGRWSVRQLAALAAMLALVAIGIVAAARFRGAVAVPRQVANTPTGTPAPAPAPLNAALTQSLREGSVEHLERSKLVVLGLSARDPERTSADDWQYERRLAGSLLADTRLYRMAAQDRGVADVARVMRDLETVLLEASLSDSSDRQALERLQRLIAKRDLVMKMQVVANGSAGL